MQRPRIWLGLVALLLSGPSGFTSADAQTGTDPTSAAAMPQERQAGPDLLLRAADQALAGQRFVEAGEILDRLEGAPVADDKVRLLRAEWLIAMNRPAEAWPLLASMAPQSEERCRISSAQLIALLDLGALDRADLLATESEQPCTGDATFLRSLGRLHLARNRNVQAVAALGSALQLEPANDGIRGDLGTALISAGQPAEALPLFTLLLAHDPGRSEARINLDYANGMLGLQPARGPGDDDFAWSRRLQYAGLGARRAGRLGLAKALLGQALIERPRHDNELWRQYADVAGNNKERKPH